MPSPVPFPNPVQHRSRHFGLALLFTIVLAFSGCVTAPEVATIVAQSNAAMLAGQLGPLPTLDGDERDAESWSTALARIDAFIEAHPDQKQTIAPLRIRQAMLLLANRQFNLAQRAFDAVNAADLVTARDLALKRNQRHLLWWFAASGEKTWTPEDFRSAETALADFKAEQATLEDSPEIRDYLAEMRAWIGITHARRSTNADRARASLVDALDQYAAIFAPGDLEFLASNQDAPPGERTLGPDLRRRLRAKAVLDAARRLNAEAGLAAHPTTAAFDRLIN